MSIGINWDETWVGVGTKVGGILGPWGRESTTGMVFNLSNVNYRHWFNIRSHRLGLGLGGGYDITIFCVFKAKSLYWLNDQQISDWGINISLGKQWSDLIKLLSPKYLKILKLLIKKQAFLYHLDDIRDWASFAYNVFEVATSEVQHPILTLDIPMVGGGSELSAFKTFGSISIYDNTKEPLRGLSVKGRKGT